MSVKVVVTQILGDDWDDVSDEKIINTYKGSQVKVYRLCPQCKGYEHCSWCMVPYDELEAEELGEE